MAIAVDREVDLFGIGSSLREARVRRGVSLEQVERDTCIRLANLEAIEAERFDALPGDVYAAAFVREYAAYLELDAEHFVEVFKETRAYEPVPIVHDAVATLTPRSRAPLWIVVALVAAAIAAGAVYLGRRGDDAKPVASAPAAAVKAPKAKQKPPVHPGPLVLRAAGGDSWVVVRFGTKRGKLVWQGTLKQGNMLRFGLDRQLWVGLGKPDAVTVHVGGKLVRINTHRSRFVFGRR
jgi:hypothetical protein